MWNLIGLIIRSSQSHELLNAKFMRYVYQKYSTSNEISMRTELGRALVCPQNYKGLCEKKKNRIVRGAVQCLFPLLPRV